MELPAHRRGVGKGLAGARWLAETGCAGKRLSELGASLLRAFGEHVLQGIVAVALEVAGCGGARSKPAVRMIARGRSLKAVWFALPLAGAQHPGVLPKGGIAPAKASSWRENADGSADRIRKRASARAGWAQGCVGEMAEPDREKAKHDRQGDVAESFRPLAVPQEIQRLQAERRKGRVASANADHEEGARFRSRQPGSSGKGINRRQESDYE